MKVNFKKRILYFLLKIAKHAFCVCLIIFVLAVGLGFLLFHKIYSGTGSLEPESAVLSNYLEEHVCKRVLDRWQENNERFTGADYKEYINPFEPRNIKILPEKKN